MKIHCEITLIKNLRLLQSECLPDFSLVTLSSGKFRVLYFHEFVTHTCKLCMLTKLGMMINRGYLFCCNEKIG